MQTLTIALYSFMDTLSYTNNSGGYRGDRGGFRAPFRGRGRGRGDGTGQQDTGGEAHPPGQASGRGRGRGRGWISEEQQAQIVAPRRPLGNRVSSEGTDDIIIAAAADRQLQHVAGFILRKKDFTQFNSQKFVRSFINSCLLNLSNHHGVDTSSILTDLGSQTGCARLTDIMLMDMDIDAGDERETLSFQFVILPLIGVLTRESVCQSTLSNESGLIYSTVYQLREQFLENGVLRCMDRLIERGSLKDYSFGAERLLRQDSSVCKISSLQRALIAITRLVYQFIKRFKDARIQLGGIIKKLHRQQVAILQLGTDSDEDRYLDIVLASEISRLQKIVNDTERSIVNVNSSTFSSQATTLNTNRPNMVYLTQTYDPPGNKSPRGPRHDNDHEDITDIKVLPTRDEITSDRPAFLPSNGVPDAPHFLPPGWKRQLDIHFRLYREDMLDSLRRGVKAFLKVLEETPSHNEDVLLQKKELRRLIGSNANVNLDVYGDVKFLGMDSSKGSSGSIMITFSQPPQLIGLNQAKREEFWERSKRRLTQGSLVSIVCHSNDNESENVSSANGFQMLLGAITRRDVKDLSKDQTTACIYISLTDPEQYIKMLNSATQLGHPQYFLVESMGGFFESYKPILKALQNSFNLAAAMPFGKYLAPTSEELEAARNGRKVIVDPPVYARAPGFKYDLSVLLGGIGCDLDITDPLSIAHAERMIQNHSIIDETQAKALVETLSREVALISGPPGTGKTKIGVDLIRVLLHNKSKVNCVPILCICYTNHALDQFLEHLLDAGITDIVRVGARSKSTRLEDFNLESLLNAAGKPQGVRDILRAVAEERSIISVEINRLEKILQSDTLTWEFVGSYLATYHVDQWEQFTEATESQQLHDDADYTMDGWSEVQSRPRVESEQVYLRWVNGEDINEMIQANREISQRKKIKSKHVNSFAALDEDDSWQQEYLRPQRIPKSRRPLSMLNGDIWEMSMYERRCLVDSWRRDVQESMMANMSRLLEHSEKLMKRKNNAYDEIRRTILLKTSVIGMTTNGAAKLQSLVEAVSPKIIICEEAGEVLEAHILAALSDSTQHLILIGDHLQLRPQIETYGLSTDSPVGRSYNLDKSLFERLVTAEINPLPMSRLTIQRRMRPSISNLIRKTLYHDLADGPNVLSYPPLSGMGANLFFMDHKHPEDSKDQYGLQSYANTFEVNMVEALVQYLIKNGYDQPGDIAVLTPYLGQLSKLRDRLRESFLLVIDERDQEQLDEKEMENIGNTTALKTNENVNVKRLNLQSHLTLRTIDNYQGEEAKIVIISLVRSDITPDELVFKSKSSIGFLKSKNRTNVLLSRAQYGMFLIGNAGLMGRRENGMWPDIIELLEKQDAVGEGLPLVCKNHPEKTSSVTTPKEFKTIAPNGGCIQPCGSNMPCGHVCPLSFCGEPCPTTDFCVECKDPKIMDYIVDVVMQQSLSEIDVDEDPILVLACGHILTMTSLDGMMDMKSYYIANEDPKTGEVEYIGKRDLPGEEVSQVPCHLCRKPIIELRRYGRRIKYAQLSLRLKKHQVSQGKIMKDALQAFQVAQVLVEEGQLEFLKAILRVEDEANSEPPSANQRNLGKYTDYATFPNSSFLNISNAYHIPKDHEKLWRRLLRPVSDCFVTFKKIYAKANKSPSKQVFDAAFSHLYRIKAGKSHSLSDGAEEQGVSMSEEEYAAISSTIQSCVLECGLPRDGHSGSSHVESLHEMTNVLILVLAQAFEVLKEVGSSSGWYWFVEDLFQCAGVYVDILKDTAQKGRYDRNLAYARMSRMELLLKIMQWLGMVTVSDKLFDAKMKRIDSLTEQFIIELNEINGRCPLGIKEDCVARAKVLEERMVDATAVAKNPVRYQPVTKKEKLELFRAMSQEVSGAGHWYRCQNGHSYFIGNCGGANQESRCYECGAPVGGSNYRLQSGNSADQEFEGFHRQGQSA
ncbi:hypothetical protein BGZ49_006383 [Haplosporangium sp. Z 27]|nr:hypothetical protein BGZ49_006383 [Haplosporangium sp. Z 27]